MKKMGIILGCAFILVGIMMVPALAGKSGCTTIQDGVLTYPAGRYLAGEPLRVGYDIFGYNYQAHMFRGYFSNVYLNGDGLPPYEGDTDAYLAENPSAATKWHWPYRDIRLIMKWNDAWLSNKDCDGDGLLDRHYGHTSYIGSGAWETNHQRGTYEVDGEECRWNYFVKIVAAPQGAYADGGFWYTADGKEIGSIIWGSFARIQQVSNDPCAGEHGLLYKGARPGFGNW